ncbi:MAG TPA: PaeR7I family type II restriction endonuclease [Phycisphaerales bacterium]|nr:PaeR7I family type II restriction endonuclease [Phycisphaerales bacterium]
MNDLDKRVAEAVRFFWSTRTSQNDKQGSGGQRDAGARSAVTGGKQLDGFVSLVRDVLVHAGCPAGSLFFDKRVELPGWFRAEKKWDLIVVHNTHLVAAVEFKSQIGPSFGNNFNNRSEEALGSATDIWAAYREGAFKPSPRPWLGYLMLLEDCDASQSAVKVSQPHFKVFPEFQNASYMRRYGILIQKLQRDRLYDGACFLVSGSKDGPQGKYREPDPELRFELFVRGIAAHVAAACKSDLLKG